MVFAGAQVISKKQKKYGRKEIKFGIKNNNKNSEKDFCVGHIREIKRKKTKTRERLRILHSVPLTPSPLHSRCLCLCVRVLCEPVRV